MRNSRSKGSTVLLPWLSLPVTIMLLVIGATASSYAQTGGREVTLNKPFEIKLDANPTTGYKWEVTYDKAFLRLEKESHKRDPSKPADYVGVGGVTTFVFVPIKKGKTTLNFRYKRPWEKEIARKKSYRVTIRP